MPTMGNFKISCLAAVLWGIWMPFSSSAALVHVEINETTRLKDIFKCSDWKSIGFYNEYYVSCLLTLKQVDVKQIDTLVFRNATLHADQLVQDSIPSPLPLALASTGTTAAELNGRVHVELLFPLNQSLAKVRLQNSSIHASALEISCRQLEMDPLSKVNTSTRGLLYGPGYNSWNYMGASYGGIGGASLSMQMTSCDQVDANDFVKAIGDLRGDLMDFRGYGSGGGGTSDSEVRGGGRIQLHANDSMVLNGSLLANGGSAQLNSDGAASGGTILVQAKSITGVGSIEACGGAPITFQPDLEEGGGGGGGGGRIVLQCTGKEEPRVDFALVKAFGGGILPDDQDDNNETTAVQWCQVGSDGTILQVVGSGNAKSEVSKVIVKGNKPHHQGPVRRMRTFSCTPLFFLTYRDQPFFPKSTVSVLVTDGASACTSYLRLDPTVAELNSTIVVTNGAQLYNLPHNDTVELSASSISLEGFVGPISQSETQHDDFELLADGETVRFLNAVLLVRSVAISAKANFAMDAFSTLRFMSSFDVDVHQGNVTVHGSIDPFIDPSAFALAAVPAIKFHSAMNTLVDLQPSQLGATSWEILADQDVSINLPFAAPFLGLSVSGRNISIGAVLSGAMGHCEPIEWQAKHDTCNTLHKQMVKGYYDGRLEQNTAPPYQLQLFASDSLVVGNLTAGSMVLCGAQALMVQDLVTAASLGCSSGLGPGNSTLVHGASGGAGHGGKGGNVEPGEVGAGEAYDQGDQVGGFPKVAWPIWPGSGARSSEEPKGIIGGAGGGIIYMETSVLTLSQSSVVSVRGGDGFKAGGGGAGGSITMYMQNLTGNGTIDLSGGDAISSTFMMFSDYQRIQRQLTAEPMGLLVHGEQDQEALGGGGGGGILRVVYKSNDSHSAADGESFLAHGGRLVSSGGKSNGGQDGQDGLAVGMNCSAGRGGALCLKCEPGSFSPGNFSLCSPCAPGSFASDSGTGICALCGLGLFNADYGQKKCQECDLGTFSSSNGSTTCTPCAIGRFADHKASKACALCPIGTISTAVGTKHCALCGIGETTKAAGASSCIACTTKPRHSHFNVHGNCTYACEKGRTGIDCLTPFERLTKPIGGPLGFAIIVFTFTISMFGLWGYVSYRSSNRQKRRFAEYKAQTLRDELSLTKLTQNLTPRLTDRDLDAHLCRFYFAGDNSVNSPWELDCSFVPPALREVVYEGSFASFASTCNEIVSWQSSSMESRLLMLLIVMIPPLGLYALRRRQLWRIDNLSKYIAQYGAGFFRDMNFRVHGATLKLGFSADFSLGYIDVLVTPTHSSPDPLASLPMFASAIRSRQSAVATVLVSGTGSFLRPYHIDTNDVMVRAVPNQLVLIKQDFWIDFVADINQQLRVLPDRTDYHLDRAAQVIGQILTALESFNSRHAHDGIEIAFGLYTINDTVSIILEEETGCFDRMKAGDPESILEQLQGFAMHPTKFAFQIHNRHNAVTVELPASAGTPKSESATQVLRRVASRGSSHSLEEEGHPPGLYNSQIRLEALFALPSPHDTSPRLSSSPRSPLLFHQEDGIGCGGSAASGSTSLQWWLRPNSWCACWRCGPFLKWSSHWLPWQNLRVVPSRMNWLSPVVVLFLVLMDVLVTFWLSVNYLCIQVHDPTAHDSGCSRAGFLSMVGLLPFAILGAPVVGIWFLNKRSAHLGRLFAIWNMSSCVNLVVALICAVGFHSYLHETILLFPVLGLALKYAATRLTLDCIAQYEHERPLRGWRGLYTTKDWYDAAYTPLIS